MLAVKSKWKKGDLVDVMTENCFSRGEVTGLEGETVKVIVNEEEKLIKAEQVFSCGHNLPDPCGKLSTSEIKIKFCKGGGDLDICKEKLGGWNYDIGGVLSDEYSLDKA